MHYAINTTLTHLIEEIPESITISHVAIDSRIWYLEMEVYIMLCTPSCKVYTFDVYSPFSLLHTPARSFTNLV